MYNQHDMAKRTLYWAELYTNQLQAGDDYRNQGKVVSINRLDFNYLDTPDFHSTFHICKDRTDLILTDEFEIHFVELRKLREQAAEVDKRLVRWMLFFIVHNQEQLEALASRNRLLRRR